jgi:DNA-directed RNA polymerase subunit K/omega
MPNKTKKSVSRFLVSEDNMTGGLKPKDDPDKLDKEEFEEKEETEEIDENEEDEDGVDGVDGEDGEDGEEGVDGEEEEDEAEGEDEEEEENVDEVEEVDDDCIYKLTKPSKKKKNTLNIDIEIEDNFEDELEEEINNKYVKLNERKTKPYLFEFERVRLLGDRARQLSMGAKPMIKNIEVMDPRTIAKLELEKKVIPLIILRELPNGLIEKWKISELKFF